MTTPPEQTKAIGAFSGVAATVIAGRTESAIWSISGAAPGFALVGL